MRNSRPKKTTSPVTDVTRKVKEPTRVLLCVRAGGRCEFDGCNAYLFEDGLTLTVGTFAEMAHIVAFKEGGPRGGAPRPGDINGIDNLMLLCPNHHKEVDHHPSRYTVQTLREYKASHEERIKHLTGLGPDRKTAVLVVQGQISGSPATIPFDQVYEATAPRYPLSRIPLTIDLNQFEDSGGSYFEQGRRLIRDRVRPLLAPEGDGARAGHVSVFALGRIPLLVCLGRELGSTVETELFQHQRDTRRWTWKSRGKIVKYRVRKVQSGSRTRVAVAVSLSGKVHPSALPKEMKGATVYEIGLAGTTPAVGVVRRREDLAGFQRAYQQFLGRLVSEHGRLGVIDLFLAVPPPVAILCGSEPLPKAHPKLRVWDLEKKSGDYRFVFEV